ncbi:unnamed protein product [Brassica rapa]|uniref:DUF7722 domain-containing protein n=1 Tax=Brassica campestris TaxID=3711 RepID=A0A8D9GFM8_BRACM|nr:unnamed protein product [Brassica rapa]
MSLSLKISHLSNTLEPRDQCRAGRTFEFSSICFRGGHWSTEMFSPKLRTRCAGSDAGISGGRSVPEWTYTGSKDETFSDLEIDDDGNGDSGGNNGGGGDDDGEEEEEEEKEFGPLVKLDEVMKETERRGIALPEDMSEAAKSVGIRKLFLLRYLDLQGSVWPLGFLMRTCTMLRNRMLADPSFLFKVGTEIAIDSCCATFAEVQKRGEDFWSEFELYAADLLVGLVVDVALVGLLAPYARIGKTSVVSSTGLFKGLKRSCAALPSSVFEAERPGCKFSVNQRIATFFYKGVLYGSVGFGCGLIGQGIANMIMTAKRSIKKSEEDVPVPPLFESAALWGVFLGLSSNARYQIINGLERVVEGSTAAKRIPVVAMAFTVGVRFANNVYGGYLPRAGSLFEPDSSNRTTQNEPEQDFPISLAVYGFHHATMSRVSQLTLIFRDKLKTTNQSSNKKSDAVVKKQPLAPSSSNDRETRGAASWSSFQMPVHYPSFTKEEYEAMSEEEVDRLLNLYGLQPTNLGDLSSKKQFAIGAFLWEKGIDSSPAEHELVNPTSSIDGLGESSLMTTLKYMVHYVFRV